MAEAAVVLPIIILAVITVILIVMFFYEASVSQSQMHMYLRSEAGNISQRMQSSTEEWDGYCNVGRDGPFRNIEARKEISMFHRGLLKGKGSGTVYGSWHVADGVAFKRAKGFLE